MLAVKQPGLITAFNRAEVPPHLNENEVNRLTRVYQEWFDKKPTVQRARQWAVFLLMRFTGCRVSEAIQVDDARDLDYRRCEVVLPTLKRHGKAKGKAKRTVPLPTSVVAEFAKLIVEFPSLKGSLFKVSRIAIFNCFRQRAKEAGLPEELRHPHVLRHTRAIELIRNGVPISAVQQLPGHASITTTFVYLRFTGQEIKQILQAKALVLLFFCKFPLPYPPESEE